MSQSSVELLRKYADILAEADEKRWDEKEWEDEDDEDDRHKDEQDSDEE